MYKKLKKKIKHRRIGMNLVNLVPKSKVSATRSNNVTLKVENLKERISYLKKLLQFLMKLLLLYEHLLNKQSKQPENQRKQIHS